ncbi:MAG: helix-turn-helix transcriptional regulator [Pseudomonadota bacterium]
MTSSTEHLAPEQIKAARALLAWSQHDLASAARVAVSTVADYERGARTPVANNAQAIREALEGQGLQFLAAGVVSKAMLPAAPPPPRAGALVRWVNATHLSQWGESRNGQSGMPELLSRLIYATVGPAAQLRFPSDDSVQYPGWDGVCVVPDGVGPVPSGASVWEIGAQRSGVRAKAEDDFVKRTAKPLGRNPAETTFVFVTPQRFVGKDAWVAEKKALGVWRDVVAFDADDLVHWLETRPAVAQWLSIRIGRRPAGLRNLEEAWAEWAGTTEPALTPDIVLTGRDDDQTEILRWLRGDAAQLSVQAEAPDEAIAFLHAAISPLPEPYRLAYLGRCVVADTPDTARELVGLGTPLVVVMAEPDPGLAQRLVADGHHVFGAFGPNATAAGGFRRLPRPWRHDLEEALAAGGVPGEEAHRLAHACGRSITVLRRLMPAAPHHRTPWAARAAPELIAAMFAGAWIDRLPRDRKIVSDLAGRPYEEVAAALAPLAGLGGPLVRVGDLWRVASLQDLWTQIGGQVTSDQIQRFEAAFQAVLGEVNPRFTQHPKSRYYEEPGEFGEEPSAALRRGLTEAMIAMAVYPDRAELLPRVGDRASAAVRKLLDEASPALWWSLSRDFHNLAEAAPEVFLDALERGLEGDNPAVMSLFRSDEGLMHPTEYLSNLLWSLEMLARSPDYLMRAALVLAHLDHIDPGGTWGNRPAASLRRIFLTWSPQTYATLEQRLKVIDRLLKAFPQVGWKLLLNLAPRNHDTSQPSSKANWRDFSSDQPEIITWQSVAEAARAVGARLLANVGDEASRWCELLEHWANFEPAWRKQAAEQFEAVARKVTDPVAAETLRDKLRGVLQRHRVYSTAQWAMPEADLLALDVIVDILQPSSVEDRVRWLFRPGHHVPGRDWRTQREDLEAAQIQAAEALLAERSADELFAFASTVSLHHALGIAIARAEAPADVKFALMKRGLLAEEGSAAEVGVGVLAGLKVEAGERGADWVHDVWRQAIDETWGESAEVRVVHQLPPTAATWAAIAERSAGLSDAYWKSLAIYWIPEDSDAELVTDRLIAVGRARGAVSWLGNIVDKAPPPGELLVRALKAAAKSDEPLEGNDATMFSYYVGLILKRLDDDPAISEPELVQLEWMYFQALRHSERPPRTLHRALAREPEFFVQLLKLIYLPDKDSGVVEPENHDRETVENLASQAYEVLHEWSDVPGADDAGMINGEALEAWVKQARKLLKEAGRGEIGDSKIGEILSASQREPDQPWPPVAVREIIEVVRSRTLESGFEVGVYNRRGVTVRMPRDGGEQERSLAARYRRDAEALRFDWPRTAACLDRIAATYEYDATREDLSAEQRDWL